MCQECGLMEPHPIRLVVDDDLQRSRLTVFFRLILAIPHFIWFFLWSIAVFLASILSWFIVLITARLPLALHRFGSAYTRYSTHLFAYLYLAANEYPGFVGEAGDYPIGDTICPAPPLIVTETQIDRIIQILRESITAVIA